MWVRGVRRDYDDIPLGNNIDIDCTLESPQPAPASGSVYSADSSWMQFLLFIINVPIPQTDKQKEDNFLHHILAKKKFRIISKVIQRMFQINSYVFTVSTESGQS